MPVRVPPAMSPSLSASISEVAAMSDSAFRKRGQGPTTGDEGPTAGDEGLAVEDRDPDMRVESLGLVGDEVVPEGQQQAALVVEIAVGEPLGFAYRALRRRERASREGQMPNVFEPTLTTWIDPYDGRTYIDVLTYLPPAPPVQTPPSLEWLSGSLLISLAPSIVPSTVSSPMISLWELSHALFKRSLEHEHERTAMTFGALWRPVLALEAWAGHGSGSVPEPEGPERVSAFRQPSLTTWIDPEDGRTYIDIPVYLPPAPPVQTPPSPEWSSGSLPISPAPSIIPSPISSPIISLAVPSPVTSPSTTEAEGFLTELGAQVEMQGGLIRDHMIRLGAITTLLCLRGMIRDIGELFTRSGAVRDEILSHRYRFRSLEHEQERVAVTFRAIWRLIAEERHARLDLAEIIDSIRRGQEPRSSR
ncbi:hypothetical protein Tco_0996530 [Tanacetum coccineum]